MPKGYQNTALTTEAADELRNLTMSASLQLEKRVTLSEMVLALVDLGKQNLALLESNVSKSRTKTKDVSPHA